ncbi:dCTP deaminase domain-containing protein [Rhodopseudomonas palustris]|uniref:Deoxycytidine triphosphate deaminase n=1 Tax=Rhodopseudomonas palustris (strain BisB18) TaxID=316056 RepID=Q214G9_RHOPB
MVTSNPPNPSGVLIKSEIQGLKLIEFPDGEDKDNADCFKPASYDMRLGAEYVSPGIVERGTRNFRILDCKNAGELIVEPFSSVVVSTYEIVRLPPVVVGKFNLRIRQALRGLFVQMGTQVEPGYYGRLFALLQNITGEPVKIKYKDLEYRLFTIEFYYTSKEAIVPSRDKPVEMKDFVRSIAVKSTLDQMLTHIKESNAKIEEEIREARPRNIAFYTILLTVLVTGVITVLAPFAFNLAPYVFKRMFPAAHPQPTAVIEEAKALSESVRSENSRLKESVKEVREKSTENEESLKHAIQRISDLEKRITRTASPGGTSDRASGNKPTNGEGRDR